MSYPSSHAYTRLSFNLAFFQMEIAKRLNAIIAQLLPFLSQEVGLTKIYKTLEIDFIQSAPP